MPLNLLAIAPGPTHSTSDVYWGITDALSALGHTVRHYPLHRALGLADTYLKVLKKGGFIEQMDQAGRQYIAGVFALDRALHYDVEWVLVFAGQLFHIDFLVKLKLAGRKLALILTESPYEFHYEWERCKFADVVFTNERKTAEILQRVHPSAHYLPHAYDPSRHRPEPPEDEPEVLAHDVVFVGTAWPERINLLEQVDWTGIDFGLYGINWKKRMGRRSPLRHHLIERTVPNAETAALYRHAKIGLNLHRTVIGHTLTAPHIAQGEAESLNPRAYELAASGLFHLSDYRAEGAEIFGSSVPTFTSAPELEYLVRYFLANPDARARTAKILPQIINGHTFEARAETISAALTAASVRGEVVPV